MSLVSEALKKAERESAARTAREQGLPVPLDTPLQPYRARRSGRGSARSSGPILALLGGAAAIALAVFFARPALERKAPNKKATPETSASAVAPAPAATPATAPAVQEVPASTSAPSPVAISPVSPSSTSAPSASEPSPAPQSTHPLPKTASQPPPSAPSTSEPPSPRASPPPAAASGRARDFYRRVDFADGTKLELGGIVYSEAAPFAYLNGRLVGVGELVEGYRIDRIERERVHLSGDAGEITLRLKGP